MGIYDRDYFREEEPRGLSSFVPRSVIGTLIVINAAVWFADQFTPEIRNYSGDVVGRWLSWHLGASVGTLTRPWYWWQFLTAGFTHSPNGIGHLLGNMLGLFFLGRSVEERYGPKEFLRFYLAALVFANIVWCVIGKLSGAPDGAGIYGASGAVVAVVVLFVFNFPDVTILFFFVIPMPAWVLGVIVVGFDIYGAMTGEGRANVAYTAHIAGAVFALLYYQLGWNFSRFGLSGLRWPQSPFRTKPRLRVHQPDDEPPPDDLSAEVDRILEKIYREGEASLTSKERSTLEAASRKYQQRRGGK